MIRYGETERDRSQSSTAFQPRELPSSRAGINSSVRLVGADGDWFPMTTGLRQGCVMPLSLFNVYMDAMMRKVTEDGADGHMVGSESVTELDFADNVELLEVSWFVMVTVIMRMEQVTKRFGINKRERKSEISFIGRGEGNVRIEDIQ